MLAWVQWRGGAAGHQHLCTRCSSSLQVEPAGAAVQLEDDGKDRIATTAMVKREAVELLRRGRPEWSACRMRRISGSIYGSYNIWCFP